MTEVALADEVLALAEGHVWATAVKSVQLRQSAAKANTAVWRQRSRRLSELAMPSIGIATAARGQKIESKLSGLSDLFAMPNEDR